MIRNVTQSKQNHSGTEQQLFVLAELENSQKSTRLFFFLMLFKQLPHTTEKELGSASLHVRISHTPGNKQTNKQSMPSTDH